MPMLKKVKALHDKQVRTSTVDFSDLIKSICSLESWGFWTWRVKLFQLPRRTIFLPDRIFLPDWIVKGMNRYFQAKYDQCRLRQLRKSVATSRSDWFKNNKVQRRSWFPGHCSTKVTAGQGHCRSLLSHARRSKQTFRSVVTGCPGE